MGERQADQPGVRAYEVPGRSHSVRPASPASRFRSADMRSSTGCPLGWTPRADCLFCASAPRLGGHRSAWYPAACLRGMNSMVACSVTPAEARHGQLRRPRPGRPDPHCQTQAEEGPVPAPSDRRLPRRDRLASVIACVISLSVSVRAGFAPSEAKISRAAGSGAAAWAGL